jgi:hypothetical protein
LQDPRSGTAAGAHARAARLHEVGGNVAAPPLDAQAPPVGAGAEIVNALQEGGACTQLEPFIATGVPHELLHAVSP